MKIFSIYISFLLAGCFACSPKTNQVVSANQKEDSVAHPAKVDSVALNPDTTTVKTSVTGVARFIVSFYSIGEGTEQNQIQKLESFLLLFRQRTGKNIPAEKTSWGREGELDYCISLSELSSGDQSMFIRDVKEELKTARWVNFSENSPCRKPRR